MKNPIDIKVVCAQLGIDVTKFNANRPEIQDEVKGEYDMQNVVNVEVVYYCKGCGKALWAEDAKDVSAEVLATGTPRETNGRKYIDIDEDTSTCHDCAHDRDEFFSM